MSAIWTSQLEDLANDRFNTTQITVSIEKSDDVNEYENDMVLIGEHLFVADDIVKLAATIQHVNNTY